MIDPGPTRNDDDVGIGGSFVQHSQQPAIASKEQNIYNFAWFISFR